MSPFEQLEAELDEWNFAGEQAVFWWRDDDAVAATPDLGKLGALAEQYDVPLALAVIPALLEQSLLAAVADNPGITVIQHGISHDNHAAQGVKKQELVDNRPDLESNLGAGFSRLDKEFAERFCPVLVPPWNRIDCGLGERIHALGFKGLSCFTPRQKPAISGNVWLVNTHVDVINWKDGRRFVGEQEAVTQLITHLRGKRSGEFDANEPSGLLTHHLVHDDATWTFLEQLLDVLDQHPATTWHSAERTFQTRWR